MPSDLVQEELERLEEALFSELPLPDHPMHDALIRMTNDLPPDLDQAYDKAYALLNELFLAEKPSELASLGGRPTMHTISTTATASLTTAFAKAKKAAIDGKVGKVTILGVNLVDVDLIERLEQGGRDKDHTFFSHCFVLGVSRAGWRIYQSWGPHGYRLDQWLGRGGAAIRDWEATKGFLRAFNRLATAQGSWSKQINDDYKECFGVDVFEICDKNEPRKPIVPKYRPWVRIFPIEDVQASNIEKFTWEQGSSSGQSAKDKRFNERQA
ncbi:MAG: hypothetical protein Q9191_001151 [Dirinaria sp. TL-2023a]